MLPPAGNEAGASPMLWALTTLPREIWTKNDLMPPSRTVMVLATSKRVRDLVRLSQFRFPAEIRVPAYAVIPTFLPTLSTMLADLDMISLDVARPAAICQENPPIGIGMHGWVALTDVLMQHPDSLQSLTCLNLQDNLIGNRRGQGVTSANSSTFFFSYFDGQKDHMRILGMCTAVTKLNLSNNNLNRGDILIMSSKIALMTNLTALDLSFNVIGALGVKYMTRAMKTCTKLLDLNFNHCEMSHGGVQWLISLTEHFPWHAVRVLNLGHNSIDVQAFTFSVCPFLQIMASLEELDISGNKLNFFATGYLMGAILDLRSLRKLVCSQNKFRLNGLSKLNFSSMMIEELDLSFNFINSKNYLNQNQVFNGIIDANLRSCTSLKRLDLSNNHIRDADLAEFHRLSYLTDLSLRCNVIGNKGCRHLARMLQFSVDLARLNISGNTRVSVKGVKDLLDECVCHASSKQDTCTFLEVQTSVSNKKFHKLAERSSDIVRFKVV